MLSSLQSNLAPSIVAQPFSYLEETKALKTIERGFALTQERRAMEGATCCDLGLPRMISSARRLPFSLPRAPLVQRSTYPCPPISPFVVRNACVCDAPPAPASSED